MNRRDRLIGKHLRERFLVTVDSNETFEGILSEADETHYVLVDAVQVAVSGERVPVDGQLWIPRLNVRYLQKA